MRRFSIATAILMAGVSVAAAQPPASVPVLNPTKIIFGPSADHNAVEPVTGISMVTLYRFEVLQDGAALPMTTVDLGKPAPLKELDPDTPEAVIGDIVARPAVLLSLPTGRKFTARVVAVGPSGEGPSLPSDPFGRANPPARIPNPPRVTR